jgi:predicted nucleic acid-binding protein
VSQWIIDASLTLRWFLEDEQDREYSLAVLAGLSQNEAVVPFLWTYEVSNGLIMAFRRKRITFDQVTEFLNRLAPLPIHIDLPDVQTVFQLPYLAQAHGLTAYDAAYLELAIRKGLPLASLDDDLKKAALASGVTLVQP